MLTAKRLSLIAATLAVSSCLAIAGGDPAPRPVKMPAATEPVTQAIVDQLRSQVRDLKAQNQKLSAALQKLEISQMEQMQHDAALKTAEKTPDAWVKHEFNGTA